MPILVVKPSVRGYLRNYVSSFASLIAVLFVYLTVPPTSLAAVAMSLIFVIFLVGAVSAIFKIKEAAISLLILNFAIVSYYFSKLSSGELGRPELRSFLARDFLHFAFTISTLASLIAFAYAELNRRSIKYVITDDGILISGGILRRKEHAIPFHMVDHVTLIQSPLGKLLNYGTIVLVPTAVAKATVPAGITYGRIVETLSKDPLKSMYGIKDPYRVYSIIRQKWNLDMDISIVVTC